ncbi:tyrosine-type recombinase/integrase [Arenibacter sp. GZD96]|uniref:tyrosine-type recombinase/integrase n=1 Tax=Aurantibrevibacter litoralis TaxID=3106030 RepID=UPI002AFF75AA|nr:tyrosine-type recombinase/integrase [Arenibacter sp. GZD-96]MEA1785515.1 tyrosine-type recombinase/integrase [Arenibacter sp. GZD-96]
MLTKRRNHENNFNIQYSVLGQLFQSKRRADNALSEFNKSLKVLSKMAGITKNVTSYVSRDSFAMCLREKGVSIDIIGETLGHQSVITTKAYVRDFGVEVLDDAVEVLLW